VQKMTSKSDIPSYHEINVQEFPPLSHPPAIHSPASSPATSPATFQDIISRDNEIFNLAGWGQNHPDRRPEAIRVRWTADEENFVADFIGMYPMATLKECYNFVIQSIYAKDVFHPNHVCSHMRLEHAFKKVKKTRSSAGITSSASPSAKTYEV
jgi:hypothetical protein